MSSSSCAASFLFAGSSTPATGSVATARSSSRALEYLPRSMYTSASSRRWKMFCGLRATAFSRYFCASSQLPLPRKPPPNSSAAALRWIHDSRLTSACHAPIRAGRGARGGRREGATAGRRAWRAPGRRGPVMLVAPLIERKRDGGALTPDEWSALIAAYTAGRVPDYQVAALLMAVVFRG